MTPGFDARNAQSLQDNGPDHEVFALRYATRTSARPQNFIGGDDHDGPMTMDYYLWLIKGPTRTFVLDTGFGPEMAKKRGRTMLIAPSQALGLLGVDAAEVQDVVISHLHYDHVGTFGDFPRAQFHLQDAEMAYATSRNMCHHQFNHGYEVEQIAGMLRLVFKKRVTFHDGDAQLAPGISVHRIGGHTDGLQCLRVKTQRGFVVLASDASHYYEHLESYRVFTTVFSVGAAIEGYRTLRRLANGDETLIVPGHDPLVMSRYPCAAPGLEGIAVALHRLP